MQPRSPHRPGRRTRPTLSRLAWAECLAMRAIVHSLTTTPQRPRATRRPS